MYRRRLIVGCFLLVSTLLLAPTPPRLADAAQPDICGPALERYVVAPRDRIVAPVALVSVKPNGGRIEQPDGLMVDGGEATLIERVSGSEPSIVLDFGQVVSGWVHIVTTASNQPPVLIAASETLQYLTDSGDVVWGEQRPYSWQPRRGADEYRSGQLTFRYLMIYLSGNGYVSIDRVSLEFQPFLGTPDTYAGCFQSSDDMLNRIWYAGAYTLELSTSQQPNGEWFVLDGSKRDRQIWIGDLAVAARIEYVTHNRPTAIRDSLKAMADLQRSDGSIPPSSFLDHTLILYDYYAWWVTSFAEYYLFTGDDAFATTYFDHLERQLNWFVERTGPNGLIVKDAGIEWSFTLGRNGEVTYLNAVYYNALMMASEMAHAFGRPAQAFTWRARAAGIRSAINARLWDAERGVYVDSDLDRVHVPQDGNALAVLYGIASPEQAQTILDYLQQTMWTPFGATNVDTSYGLGLIHDKRIWPFIGYFEVEARFESGDAARAYELIRRQWGHMLASDPGSTFWEWMQADGTIENGFASLAHAWSGGVTASLSEHTLGIQRTGSQFTTFDAIPAPGDLSWARGRVPTPQGAIDVSWQLSEGVFLETLSVPNGSRARLGVPLLGAEAVVRVDGQVIWADGASSTVNASSDGRYVYIEVGPGSYQVESFADASDVPATGFFSDKAFMNFWRRSGGLALFGYRVLNWTSRPSLSIQRFD